MEIAKELRIGNIVHAEFAGDPSAIVKISADGILESSKGNLKVQGVIMTPTILEKYGFDIKRGERDSQSKISTRTIAIKDNVRVVYTANSRILFVDIDGLIIENPTPIACLHHMQNLYFSLKGKELNLGL